ncbi:MAG TPA: hypothetical protein VG897_05815 [Terriglobales bacterium]|nr:hypothetical protein [Terriglobales bacterium]
MFDLDYCKQKSRELREMASTAQTSIHRVSYLRLAETWEKLADDMQSGEEGFG